MNMGKKREKVRSSDDSKRKKRLKEHTKAINKSYSALSKRVRNAVSEELAVELKTSAPRRLQMCIVWHPLAELSLLLSFVWVVEAATAEVINLIISKCP